MKKQHIYLGLGLVAVAGLGIYLYRRNKSEKTSGATGKTIDQVGGIAVKSPHGGFSVVNATGGTL